MANSKFFLALVVPIASISAAPRTQESQKAPERSIKEFVSFVEHSSKFRDVNHARVHAVIDAINPSGMQFRYFEEDRFPGEHAQIKSRIKWSWLKSIHADGKGSGVLEMRLSRDPEEWSNNGDGKWRPNNEHSQIAYIPLPDKRTAVIARDLLRRIVSSEGFQIAAD